MLGILHTKVSGEFPPEQLTPGELPPQQIVSWKIDPRVIASWKIAPRLIAPRFFSYIFIANIEKKINTKCSPKDMDSLFQKNCYFFR